jgi:hypothetical protein
MKRLAVLSAAALLGIGALTSSAAEARGGGAIAAGIIGGLAAGALLGAAVSDAHAAPGYGYAPPAYGYGYGPPPVAVYRPAPVTRSYVYEAPVYETRRVVSYDRGPGDYGYRPRPRHWGEDCDRPYGDRGW